MYQKLQVSHLCMLSIERRLKLFVAKRMLWYSPPFQINFFSENKKRDLHYQQWIWKQPCGVRLCTCIIIYSDAQIYNFRSNNETKIRFRGKPQGKRGWKWDDNYLILLNINIFIIWIHRKWGIKVRIINNMPQWAI